MTWTRLDDSFMDHPKVHALGQEAPAAIYLWTAGLCYAARFLTDGFVPIGMLARLSPFEPEKAAAELVRVGLWEQAPGGYRIHDFLEYNLSREAVLEHRANEKARKAEWRKKARPRGTDAGTDGVTDTASHDTPVPLPVPLPVPDSTTTAASVMVAKYQELYGRRPSPAAHAWISSIGERFGEDRAVATFLDQHASDPDPATILGRTDTALSDAQKPEPPAGRWEFDNATSTSRWIPHEPARRSSTLP